MTDKEPGPEKKDPMADLSAMMGMGGLFEGVSSLITKFGELAERGESLQKTMGQTSTGKPYESSMGFSVKFGPGGKESGSSDGFRVTPLNKTTKAPSASAPQSTSGRTESMPKTREPNVDVFQEEDHLLLVAEMPGVTAEDIELSFEDKTLVIQGASKTAQFKKSVDLSRAYTPEQVTVTANNGVVEIRLQTN